MNLNELPYVVDLDTPRSVEDLDISFLMSCQQCKGEGPLFKEWSGNRKLCAECRESEEEKAGEHRAEERFERYCMANFMR